MPEFWRIITAIFRERIGEFRPGGSCCRFCWSRRCRSFHSLRCRISGRCWSFWALYVTLYVVAVRRLPQVTIAIGLMAALLIASIFAAGIYNTVVNIFTEDAQVSSVERVKGIVSEGVPDRIKQRFYLWLNGSVAPNKDENEWWAKEVPQAPGKH